MKKGLQLLTIILTQLGIIDASYLTWEKFNGVLVGCGAAFDCQSVLSSPYSSIGPVPLSLLGVAYYGTFFVLAIVIFLGLERFKIAQLHISLPLITVLWSVMGVAFSSYFVYLMGAILRDWCLFCLLSALNCVGLFILSIVIYRFNQKEADESANSLQQ